MTYNEEDWGDELPAEFPVRPDVKAQHRLAVVGKPETPTVKVYTTIQAKIMSSMTLAERTHA